MFNTTSYLAQSKGLLAENGFQFQILRLADTATLFREIGKIGSAIGIVTSVASIILNYDCKLSVSVTMVGGLTWFCNHKLAQYLEPKAQSMLEYLKDLQKQINQCKDNATVRRISKKELQLLQKHASRIIENLAQERRKNSTQLSVIIE